MSYQASPLYEALQKSGKSQVAVAKEIGVDRGVFGRIVRQQQLPTPDQAVWISKALGVPQGELFPDVNGFRGGELEQRKQEQIAERILLLERRAAELLATNAALEVQCKELVETFAAKVSEMEAENIRLTNEVAVRDKKIAERAGTVLKHWVEKFKSDKEKQALQQQIRALQAQVDSANARAAAVAAGATIAGLGALAALAARD